MTISLPLLAGILFSGVGLGYALGCWRQDDGAIPATAALAAAAGEKKDALPKGVVPAVMLADLKAVAAGAGTAAPNATLLALVKEALRMEPESLRSARLTWLFYSMTPVDLDAMNAIFSALYSNEGRSLRAETALLREYLGRMEGTGSFKRWDRENNGWAQGRTLLAEEVVVAKPDEANRLFREADQLKFPTEIRKGVLLGLLTVDPAAATALLRAQAEALKPESYAGELADQVLNQRGIAGASQWLNQANAAGLPPALLAGLAEGLRSRALSRMSAEAWGAFLISAPGPVWPAAEELTATAEMLCKRQGLKPREQIALWNPVLAAWVKRGPAGPAQWLEGKAGTPGYDAAAAAYVRQIKALDATAATAWAETIRHPEFKKLAAGGEP